MMKIKFVLLVIVLGLYCPAFSLSIAYIVGDTTSIGTDSLLVQRLENRLGYTVALIDDNAVDTFSNWSSLYDGILISDLVLSTNMAPLKDTSLGILTLDRYTEDELGLASTRFSPSGHGRRLVNYNNGGFICDPFMDTIFPYQYDNQYIGYYGGLAEGAEIVFNTLDFVGSDSACVIILDSNSLLTDSSFSQGRRAFCGVFRLPESMDYCHSWELFDRLAAWTFGDTNNVWFSEYDCWGGSLEIDACWGELLTSSASPP